MLNVARAFIIIGCSQKYLIAGDNLGISQILGILINRGIGPQLYTQ
jgi:hypothetical protein